MNQPKISAIVSTYNSEKFFRNKIEDLLQQSIIQELEIIVVNSGSTQNEDNIIQDYIAYSNLKYIYTKERETIYKAWNRAIKNSSGKYVTNSNTDDRLRNDALELMSFYLDTHNDVAIVYADQYISSIPNEDFNSIVIKQKYPKPDYNHILLLERCIVGSQPMWRNSLHQENNWYFDESFEIAGDYEFECRVAQVYNLAHIPEVLGIYYQSKKSENKEYQNFNATFAETYKVMKKYSNEYILSLKKEEVQKIIFKFELLTSLPKKLYSMFRKIYNKILPSKEKHTFMFLIWFLSLLYEYNNNYNKSLTICLKYSENDHPLISARLNELKAIKN